MFQRVLRQPTILATAQGAIQATSLGGSPAESMDRLVLAVDVNLTAGAGNAGLTGEGFWRNFLINILLKNGEYWVKNCPAYFIDLLASFVRQGQGVGAQRLIDTGALPLATGTIRFFVEVPCRLPLAAMPGDYEISPAEIDRIDINVGAADANITINSVRVTVLAYTKPRSGQKLGVLQQIEFVADLAVQTMTIPLNGRKLANLLFVTGNNAANPITGVTGASVKVDEYEIGNGQIIGDLGQYTRPFGEPFWQQIFGQIEVPAGLGGGTTPAWARFAPLYRMGHGEQISEVPGGNNIKLQYNANAIPLGTGFYLMHTLLPTDDQSAVRRVLTPDGVPVDLSQLLTEVKSGGSPLSGAIKQWLPREYRGVLRMG